MEMKRIRDSEEEISIFQLYFEENNYVFSIKFISDFYGRNFKSFR